MKFNNRYLVGIISLAVFIGLIYYFSQIVTYVMIAWVLSLIGAPLMRFWMEKAKLRRFRFGATLSAVLTLLSFILLFTGIMFLIGPLIYQQAINLANVDYQKIAEALAVPLNQLDDWLNGLGLVTEKYSNAERIRFIMEDWFDPGRISAFFSNIIQIAGEVLIGVFSILFITFFFLKEQGLFLSFIRAVVPTRYEEQSITVIKDSILMLTRYFGGILTQILIITTIASILLSLFGVTNAILIASFAAVINVIPYVGPILGAMFGLVLTISGNLDADFYATTFPLMMKVVATFAIIQMIDNFILQPVIFSNSVLAHPLEIFIVIMIGAQLGGIPGMILAIPAYTIFRVFGAVFLSEFKIVQRLTQRMKESGELDNI